MLHLERLGGGNTFVCSSFFNRKKSRSCSNSIQDAVKDDKFTASERARRNPEIPKELCDVEISLFVGNCFHIPLAVTLSTSWLRRVFPLESEVTFVSSIFRLIASSFSSPPLSPVVLSHPRTTEDVGRGLSSRLRLTLGCDAVQAKAINF